MADDLEWLEAPIPGRVTPWISVEEDMKESAWLTTASEQSNAVTNALQ